MIVTISRIAMTTGAPRLAGGADEMLTLEINLPTFTNLTLHLESNPPPSTFTFNRDFNGVFNVVCSNNTMRSRHVCVINVTMVTEAEEGVHVLDIRNAIGHTRVRFNVSRGSEYRHTFVFDFFSVELVAFDVVVEMGEKTYNSIATASTFRLLTAAPIPMLLLQLW